MIVVVASFSVFFAVILVHNALTKTLFSKVSACLNFYFAPFTCCLASFHAHTYYHALLILLYNSFVNSCRRGLALQCSSCGACGGHLVETLVSAHLSESFPSDKLEH